MENWANAPEKKEINRDLYLKMLPDTFDFTAERDFRNHLAQFGQRKDK